MISFSSFSSFSDSLVRNTFGVVVETATEPKMRKTNNPFFGRVIKQTRYSNVALGRDYYQAIANRLTRQGDATEKSDLAALFEAPKGRHAVEGNAFLYQSDKDETQYYLRLTMNANTVTKSNYLVDGREATAEEVAEIKTFLYASAPSAKQAALGLEQEVVVRDIKLDNVKLIQQGAKVLK